MFGKKKLREWDPARHIRDGGDVEAFLEGGIRDLLEDGDIAFFLDTLEHIERSPGNRKLARKLGADLAPLYAAIADLAKTAYPARLPLSAARS